jgi:bifunctional non-homologous end joining protein LigD
MRIHSLKPLQILNHPNLILFPEQQINKQRLADYYKDIAVYLLPYLKQRPLTLQCFPKGITEPGYIQQHVQKYFPKWFKSIELPKKTGGTMQHILCEDVESLIYLVDHSMVTPHRWLSQVQHPEQPDLMIFDLDPPPDQFKQACKAAKLIKQALLEQQLTAFVMTTGSKGLHVVVPILAKYTFDEVRRYAKQIAQQVVKLAPDEFTLEVHKEQRLGRTYLDIMRNTYGQTAVAPYAVRALPSAPVATPLAWEELDPKDLIPQKFTIINIAARLASGKNPWQDFFHVRQSW